MKKRQILTYTLSILFSLSFILSCKTPSVIGTWEIDEKRIEKDNPEIGGFTLDAVSSLFYILEFKEDKRMSFLLFDIEKKWETNDDNEIIIKSKEGNITVRLIDKKHIEIEAIDKQEKEERRFKFHFNKITTKIKQTNPVLDKIYQTKNKDKDGWSYYIVFKKDKFFMFSTNSSDTLNLEMFKTGTFNINESWSKERGNYIVKGNTIYTASNYGTDKIKTVSPKELIINNNYLYLKE